MTKENQEMPKKEKKLTKEEIIKNLVAEIAELKLDVLRTRADFENYRKRKDQEVIDARDRGIVSFVEDLLPAIDNFEMSLQMTDNVNMFTKGVEMIHKNLIDTLKSHKIEEFTSKVGEEFNPNLHDPILIETDEFKAGQVVNILKKGYKHKDKIVRPVRVQVAKDKEE